MRSVSGQSLMESILTTEHLEVFIATRVELSASKILIPYTLPPPHHSSLLRGASQKSASQKTTHSKMLKVQSHVFAVGKDVPKTLRDIVLICSYWKFTRRSCA